MAAEEWKVGKSTGACASCGGELRPGDIRHSGLYAEGGELVRRDYCAECWDKRTVVSIPADEKLGQEFSHWRTIVPEPEEVEDKKRKLSKLIDTETLFEILRDMLDSTDPRKMTFRFVVALMLMRRKKLKLVSIARRPAPDGSGTREVLVLKRAGRGRKQTFDVADVKMSEEQMVSAQDEVGALLGIGTGAETEGVEAEAAGTDAAGAEVDEAASVKDGGEGSGEEGGDGIGEEARTGDPDAAVPPDKSGEAPNDCPDQS